jgi:hypothetical protein
MYQYQYIIWYSWVDSNHRPPDPQSGLEGLRPPQSCRSSRVSPSLARQQAGSCTRAVKSVSDRNNADSLWPLDRRRDRRNDRHRFPRTLAEQGDGATPVRCASRWAFREAGQWASFGEVRRGKGPHTPKIAKRAGTRCSPGASRPHYCEFRGRTPFPRGCITSGRAGQRANRFTPETARRVRSAKALGKALGLRRPLRLNGACRGRFPGTCRNA